jgi:hypothetical protein
MPIALLTISPSSGRPGTNIVAKGQNFRPQQSLRIECAGKNLAETTTNSHGGFEVTLAIPRAAPGSLVIKARTTERSAVSAAESTFTVLPRPSGPPCARIEPHNARILKGDTAFFDGGYSIPGTRGGKITKWQWLGPAGQSGTERAFITQLRSK